MKIEVTRPWILLLIPILMFLTIYSSRKLKINKIRKIIISIIRNCIIIMLILSLADLSIIWRAKDITTIFLVDCSDSMEKNKKQCENFVENAIKTKSSRDSFGVMSFGDNALVDNFISKKSAFSGLETEPNGRYTNIENALMNSLSIIPNNTKKRIVLLTDGKENQGNSTKLVPTLKAQGVNLEVYKINNVKKDEVAVENLIVPKKIRVGQEFNVEVDIKSTVNTNSKITLFSGNTKKIDENVKITKGNNKFIFKDIADVGGFKTYKVNIEPSLDNEISNNEASTFTEIRDKARILVIKDKEDANEVIKMLEASNMNYDVVKAGGEPSTLKGLSKYKTIITCNVSAENLSEGFLNSLESYVKDLGGGFIAAGGENSFALGGYSKTSLEDVLPVYMDMRGKKEIPDMSMMLVIDRSGSMGGTKMELAKEAAARTVDFLRDRDEIGVLAFDDKQYWVVERQKAKDKKSIRNQIGTLRGGGGTSILPALSEAYNSLKESNAKIKHIILLTDGQGEGQGYDTLISDINKHHITVSTVSVGQDSDVGLLKYISEKAKGRFYYTDESTNIPRIFAKETFMVSRTYLNNKKFTPIVQNIHPIISGVYEEGFPPLLGYVGATPKNTAKVILKSNEDDPILTVWQYGLGKTAAWNSDISGKWSANFIGWNKNLKLWQNMINWTVENYNNESMIVNTNIDGNKGIVNLEDKRASEDLDVEMEIIGPSMKKIKSKLYPVRPQNFSGCFEMKETGAYIIKINELKNGGIVNSSTTGICMQYSPEYKIADENQELDRLVKQASGKFINKPSDVFKGKLKEIYAKRNITTILLIAALMLFVLDIALRRINLPYNKLQSKILKVKSKVKEIVPTKNSNNKIKNNVNKNVDKYNDEKEYVDNYNNDDNENQKNDKSDNDKKTNNKQTIDTSTLLRIKKRK
ncbi:VWA domain-containing protein [Haloimpatiens sp. FM7330]|uniref:VWA domain-containing protein n=1 Tax=Haloimpatiens sp. FM7330 TaxID=3298610 RepID=UPI00362BF415